MRLYYRGIAIIFDDDSPRVARMLWTLNRLSNLLARGRS